MTRPEFLASGERARLLPVVSESNKENRLIGPVLGALPIIPELAGELLGQLGVRVGARSTVSCFTEVVFAKVKEQMAKGSRPDGLIEVDTGRSVWRCLVEAKFGNNKIDAEQVERYLEIARAVKTKDFKIDAILTISNEFVATPKHSPVKVSGRLTRNCDVFHLSWSAVATAVDLLLANDKVDDIDRTLVLEELHSYLRHPASQISGFSQMPTHWKDVVKAAMSNVKLPKNGDAIQSVVGGWHEEQKDMCLILTRFVKRTVKLKLPKAHEASNDDWRSATADLLLENNILKTVLDVPNAASPIVVEAMMARKVVKFSMRVKIPEDLKSTKARVNWLARQLRDADDPRLELSLNFPGRKHFVRHTLAEIRETPEVLDEHRAQACTSIDVVLEDEQGGKFTGSKTFIENTEKALIVFYEQIVAKVKNWQPSAPKPVKDKEISSDEVDY